MGILRLKTLLLISIVLSTIFIYQNTETFSFDSLLTVVNRQYDSLKTLFRSKANPKTTIYSSRDETGVIEFSDSEPEDNSNTKSIIINSNTNLVPSVPLNQKIPDKKENTTKDSISDISPMTPYTDPEKIKQLVNDAKNIEDVLNNRKTDIDQQLNDL